MVPGSADRAVAARFGAFAIKEFLGEGSMGAVYRATRPDGREVALKILRREWTISPEARKRFLRQAMVASSLTCANTVEVLDFGEGDGGLFYIAMELLRGERLSDMSKRQGKLAPRVAADFAVQVCRSLVEAHDKDVVHGDLRPKNLFLSRCGDGTIRVTVLDYGLAQVVPPGSDEAPTIARTVGTLEIEPSYESPEVRRGEPPTKASDLCSLGAILSEMVAGRSDSGDLVPLGPEVPAPLAALVARLLKERPDERPEDVAVVLEDLSTFLETSPFPLDLVPTTEHVDPRTTTDPEPPLVFARTTDPDLDRPIAALPSGQSGEAPAVQRAATPREGPRAAVADELPTTARRPAAPASVDSEPLFGDGRKEQTVEDMVAEVAAEIDRLDVERDVELHASPLYLGSARAEAHDVAAPAPPRGSSIGRWIAVVGVVAVVAVGGALAIARLTASTQATGAPAPANELRASPTATPTPGAATTELPAPPAPAASAGVSPTSVGAPVGETASPDEPVVAPPAPVAVPAPAAPSTAASVPISRWVGRYQCDRGAMRLVQQGSRIIGFFGTPGEFGRLWGDLEGDALVFRWEMESGSEEAASGHDSGRGRFRLAADGSGRLTGTFGYGHSTTDGGEWNALPLR